VIASRSMPAPELILPKLAPPTDKNPVQGPLKLL
jgi:hypothetical protein